MILVEKDNKLQREIMLNEMLANVDGEIIFRKLKYYIKLNLQHQISVIANMVTQADKTQENKSKAASNNVTKDKSRTASDFQFVDNRQEAIVQKRLQYIANNSPQSLRAIQLKAMAIGNYPKATLQGKFETVQLQEEEEELQMQSETVQRQEEEEELQMKSETVQRQEEEEELQMKSETVQRQEEEEELQMKSETIQRQEEEMVQGKFEILQKKEEKTTNNTGLPDKLKSGIENLSGHSMDNVKVHYNSDKPAQLQAHAYAQGTDIHVAPGQEKHLPHEAWHVVQQKQGRVKPTMQLHGKVNVNDDVGLEKEADVMGTKALAMGKDELKSHPLT